MILIKSIKLINSYHVVSQVQFDDYEGYSSNTSHDISSQMEFCFSLKTPIGETTSISLTEGKSMAYLKGALAWSPRNDGRRAATDEWASRKQVVGPPCSLENPTQSRQASAIPSTSTRRLPSFESSPRRSLKRKAPVAVHVQISTWVSILLLCRASHVQRRRTEIWHFNYIDVMEASGSQFRQISFYTRIDDSTDGSSLHRQ